MSRHRCRHRAYLDSGRARRDRTGHRLPRQRARTVRHQLDARARHGLGVADDCVWRPGSHLWRITLDPSSTRQRLAFVGLWRFLPCLSAHPSSTNCGTRLRSSSTFPAITPMISTSMGMWPMRWSPAGLARLPVPEQLAATEHPYDVATRAQLLANGASPLYWDYAYYDGHWYSYFGVLPAVLLFVPYRLLAGHNLRHPPPSIFSCCCSSSSSPCWCCASSIV